MRVWHLLDLAEGCGPAVRELVDDEPLFLPSVLAPEDRELLLAFFQRVAASRPLQRLEVDWHYRLLDADRAFLARRHQLAGAGEHLLVVRVQRAGVDLADVLGEPGVRAFRHVAVVGHYPLENERWGTLSKIAKQVAIGAEERYRAEAERLDLRTEAWRLVEPLVEELLNPVDVLETYNHLVATQLDVSDEAEADPRGLGQGGRDPLRDKVFRRALSRLIRGLELDLLLGLAIVARGGESGLSGSLAARWPTLARGLRVALLLRDGEPVRWARLLVGDYRDLIHEALAERVVDPDEAEELKSVLGLLEVKEPAAPLRSRVLAVFSDISEGRLDLAADSLDAIAAEPGFVDASDEDKGYYWDARGRLLRGEGRWGEAEVAFRRSLALLEKGGATPTSRGITTSEFARGLRDQDRWSEAEPLFREALRLKEEGGATPTSRGITMHELARGLRDQDRWSEAEPLFREALRLAEEGGATPTSRGIIISELARGLRDHGRWDEAEPLFREALRLKEEGGATPTSRGITMHALACGLRDNGRWDEAEPLFREALRLKEEGGDTPTSRGIIITELARGLRDHGRWDEAEPLFREALRLGEEGGATPTSRGITLSALARGLRDNGRWDEAEPLFREALRLAEEGGDTPSSRGITLQAFARGLRDNGRVLEALEVEREAAALLGDADPG